ncbi:MAG TPA: M20/M25/M40 family metallo-hydrolase [Geminicoccus sp.]|jgi:acetylornithine deacetylase|uniref:M20 family metallopeptidase n=1 Tax=Geminicoccus sp. TaxID=2024832 RepID=UPI002E367DAC|nr:M20/M25/M40 family metallo-hydrolase [Geminicoccus sp.]HEX2526068.1 M20/M25/M40 family metallo-hydrolase [Geminicoccus sp.]
MITDDDVIELLSALVAIPSVNPAFRQPNDMDEWFGEEAVGKEVARRLSAMGLQPELDDVLPGRANVLAMLKGRGASGRKLILECHMDTVQVSGMSIEPFTPTVRDGRLYGRGSVDDKACIAMMLLALRELAADPPAIDVEFVAAVDEEFQFKGVLHHLRRAQGAIGGIAGEPTSLKVVTACKGCVRWTIEVRGKAAHTSQPQEGIDAIEIATDLLAHLRLTLGAELRTRMHPLVGSPSLVCTMIEGGQGPNTVSARCTMTFDRRTLPGETGEDAWREIDAIVRSFAAGLPEGAAITMHPPFIDSISMDVEPGAAITEAMRAACRKQGLPDDIIGVPYGSDATKLTTAGIPTIIFGPGSIDQAHTADEFVPIAEVATAARMLVDVVRQLG